MLPELADLFARDLQKLITELEGFADENDIWKTQGSISNSAGNLSLHLVGNLKTFIGLRLGNFAYQRNREAEFATRFLPRAEVIEQVRQTKETVSVTLQKLPESELSTLYPENPLGTNMTVQHFLLHLLTHLNYHLGQVNYLRRTQQ